MAITGLIGLIYFGYRMANIDDKTTPWQVGITILIYLASCLMLSMALCQWMISQQYG